MLKHQVRESRGELHDMRTQRKGGRVVEQVASQKVQDGEAVLRVNLVRRLGQRNMLGNIEWLDRRLGLKCIVIRRPLRRLGFNNIFRELGQ